MTWFFDVTRRSVLIGGGAIATLPSAIRPVRAQSQTLCIGVQKYGTLIVLEARGSLEKRLGPQGVSVEWTEFSAGPQLLEALNAGSLDFGITGEAPPVFAQAAGVPFVYVAVDRAAPQGEAILVAKDSPIRTVADLKGKRVAFNRGSDVHCLLIAALQRAGLQFSDIQPIYLAPADGRAAFARGSVDAWVIWDPYLAAGQAATQTRVLADATGLARNPQFYLASASFAKARPDLVRALLLEISKTDIWAAKHQADVADLLASRTGLPLNVLHVALARLGYGIAPITPDVVASQQRIADTFFKAGLLLRAIAVREAVWHLA
jgi:sulfonate transport system substrate-binding protein